jgi:hypothetical protein
MQKSWIEKDKGKRGVFEKTREGRRRASHPGHNRKKEKNKRGKKKAKKKAKKDARKIWKTR